VSAPLVLTVVLKSGIGRVSPWRKVHEVCRVLEYCDITFCDKATKTSKGLCKGAWVPRASGHPGFES
jgi:hypothetical protein